MKKIAFLTAVACVFSLAACKKDNKTVTCKLTGRASFADSARVSYDAQGRVSTYEIVGESAYTFNYTSALAAQCVVSVPGNPTYTTYNVFLNSNGTVASMNNSLVIGGTTINYTYYFTYNAEGRIAKCLQRYDQTGGISVKLDSMVYENGNLVRKYKFVSASVTGPFYLQEYAITTYTDMPNKVGYHAFSFVEEPTSLLSGFYPFFHLYGNASDKLPAETSVYTNTGTLSFKMSYTYLMDENGYVKEENVSRSIISPSTENRRFTYSCN